MIVSACSHERNKKDGKDKRGNQRFRCLDCRKQFGDQTPKPLGDMRIDTKDACTALSLLLEGMSIRATERITGLHRDTICDLILVVGENCRRFHDRMVVDVKADDIQCDEIWSYVGMKQRTRIAKCMDPDHGDSWTWIGMERNTKLVLAYHVGQRHNSEAKIFLRKLNNATTGHFQISTDGLGAYTHNVPFTFGNRCDFAQLIKTFQGGQHTVRYSPGSIAAAVKKPIYGAPRHDRICTSHVERLNLTLRMQMRRFTRLTNGFSKSVKHHIAMQNIFFAWYNFCRKHESLKATPAMASGLAVNPWLVKDLIERAA